MKLHVAATVLAARGGRRSAHTSTKVSRYVVFRFSIKKQLLLRQQYYHVSNKITVMGPVG